MYPVDVLHAGARRAISPNAVSLKGRVRLPQDDLDRLRATAE